MAAHTTRTPGTVLSAAIYNGDFLTQEAALRNVTNAGRVQGLRGVNTPSFTTTRFDLQADWVLLRHAAGTDLPILRTQPTALTCQESLAGPIANGRDQAAAFSSGTWLYFYFIWNGTTLATIVSATPPPTGPTLPTGYTHWALATTVRLTGSVLLQCFARGSWVYYREAQTSVAVNVTASSAIVTVTASTLIPPHALAEQLLISLRADPGSSTGGSDWQVNVGPVGAIGVYIGVPVWINTTMAGYNTAAGVLANVNQQYLYQIVKNSGSGLSNATFSSFLLGYQIPNGGE